MLETIKAILTQKGFVEGIEGEFQKVYTNEYNEVIEKTIVSLIGKKGLLVVSILLDENGCIIDSNEERYLVREVKDLYDILN